MPGGKKSSRMFVGASSYNSIDLRGQSYIPRDIKISPHKGIYLKQIRDQDPGGDIYNIPIEESPVDEGSDTDSSAS